MRPPLSTSQRRAEIITEIIAEIITEIIAGIIAEIIAETITDESPRCFAQAGVAFSPGVEFGASGSYGARSAHSPRPIAGGGSMRDGDSEWR